MAEHDDVNLGRLYLDARSRSASLSLWKRTSSSAVLCRFSLRPLFTLTLNAWTMFNPVPQGRHSYRDICEWQMSFWTLLREDGSWDSGPSYKAMPGNSWVGGSTEGLEECDGECHPAREVQGWNAKRFPQMIESRSITT